MTVTPTKTDIKSGGGNHNYPGNKVYNKLVSSKRKAFVLAHTDTKAKNAVVLSIYETVTKQSPPGRFLGKNKDGSYHVKSKEEALKKIKRALNENKAKIEEYFRLRGQFPPPAKTSTKVATKATSKHEKKHQSSSKTYTSSDWQTLSIALGKLNEDEIKEVKRQKLRNILLAEERKKRNGKKIVKQ